MSWLQSWSRVAHSLSSYRQLELGWQLKRVKGCVIVHRLDIQILPNTALSALSFKHSALLPRWWPIHRRFRNLAGSAEKKMNVFDSRYGHHDKSESDTFPGGGLSWECASVVFALSRRSTR